VDHNPDDTAGANASMQGADPGERPENGDGQKQADTDPLQLLIVQVAQLGEFTRHLATARIDAFRVGIRNRLLRTVATLCGALVGLATAIIAAAYVIDGTARGVAILFGGSVWAGRLVGGLAVLILLGLGLVARIAWISRASRRERAAKYEARKARQRARFGQDIEHRRNGDQ
jgi:hypothetical protein